MNYTIKVMGVLLVSLQLQGAPIMMLHNDAPELTIEVCYGKEGCTKLKTPSHAVSTPIVIQDNIKVTVRAHKLKPLTFGIKEINRNRGGLLEYHIVAKKGKLSLEIQAPPAFFD